MNPVVRSLLGQYLAVPHNRRLDMLAKDTPQDTTPYVLTFYGRNLDAKWGEGDFYYVELGDYTQQINGRYLTELYTGGDFYKYVVVFKKSLLDYLRKSHIKIDSSDSYATGIASLDITAKQKHSTIDLIPNRNCRQYSFRIWCQPELNKRSSDYDIYRYRLCHDQEAKNEMRISTKEFLEIMRHQSSDVRFFDVFSNDPNYPEFSVAVSDGNITDFSVRPGDDYDISVYLGEDILFMKNITKLIEYISKNSPRLIIYMPGVDSLS